MPIIARLAHPIHGEKDAYTPAEVKEAKENGWEEVTPEETAVPSFFSVSTNDDDKAKLDVQLEELNKQLTALKTQVKGETTRLGNLKAQVAEEQAKLDALKGEQRTPPPAGPNLGAIVNTLTNPGT